MKKVLFLSLILAIGMMSFAQVRAPQGRDLAKTSVLRYAKSFAGNETPSVSNFTQPQVMTSVAAQTRANDTIEEFEPIVSDYYDLQSNSALGNRNAQWPDGCVAVTMTWDNSGSSSYDNRGTGYNFYDGENFGDMPEDRIESLYSGWPSIAPLGEGEILASHGGGNVNLYRRDSKGEGEWDNINSVGPCSWPRIATTDDGRFVHLVAAEQNSSNTLENYVYYMRSTEGGETFTDLAYPPLVDVEGMYKYDIGADDYVMAANGNTIAILFGSMNFDLFYIISRDNGETWEKQIVAPFPYDHALDWNQTAISIETDTIWSCDNTFSIAIDDNGVVHVVFGLGRWVPAPSSGAGYYSSFPYTQGIVYWNSEYVNEQGGHEIPLFGDWSGDANFGYLGLNGTNGVSNTLNDERLMALADADGNQHLHLFGFVDDNHDGEYGDYGDLLENYIANDNLGYRSLGIATMPSISIDNHGNLACMYSCLSETRVWTSTWYYRGVYVTFRHNGRWYDDYYNLNADFVHAYGEEYYTCATNMATNGSFWFTYIESDTPGLFVDGNGSPGEPNTLFAVKLTPDFFPWGVERQEATNPMTSTRVYPNPATDVLNIEVNASQNSEMSINVYNLMGQKVMEKNVNINMGINTPSISTADFTSGIYFVTVKANGFENTMKFIVK